MHAKKTDRLKWIVSWVIMSLGLLFTLGAAIIMRPTGLMNFNVIITLIALLFVISVICLLPYWIFERLIRN